jgi:hypothetical protein
LAEARFVDWPFLRGRAGLAGAYQGLPRSYSSAEDAPIILIQFGGRFSVVQPWVRNLVPTAQDSDVGENFYYLIAIAPH